MNDGSGRRKSNILRRAVELGLWVVERGDLRSEMLEVQTHGALTGSEVASRQEGKVTTTRRSICKAQASNCQEVTTYRSRRPRHNRSRRNERFGKLGLVPCVAAKKICHSLHTTGVRSRCMKIREAESAEYRGGGWSEELSIVI